MESEVFSFRAAADKPMITENGRTFSVGNIGSAAEELSSMISGNKLIGVCVHTFSNMAAAVFAAGKARIPVMFLDPRNSCEYNLSVLKENECKVLIADSDYSVDSVKVIDMAKLNFDRNSEQEFSVPDILFPYISDENSFETVCYSSKFLMETAAFFKNKLKVDFSDAYCEHDSRSSFGMISWLFAVSCSGSVTNKASGNTVYMTGIDKAASLAENIDVESSVFLTYDEDKGDESVKFSLIAEEKKIRWYNVFGYPYFNYITKIRKIGGRYLHIGKPFGGYHTYVLNDENKPLPYSLVGKIYDDFARNSEPVALDGSAVYNSGFRGCFSGERCILFSEMNNGCAETPEGYVNKAFAEKLLSGISKKCELKINDKNLLLVCNADGKADFCKAEKIIEESAPFQYSLIKVYFTFDGEWSERMICSADVKAIREIVSEYTASDISVTAEKNNSLLIYMSGISSKAELEKRLSEYVKTQLTEIDRLDLKVLENGMECINISYVNSDNILSEKENAVLDIWKDILNMPDLRLDENFYQAGGNSLDLVKMLYRISEYAGKEIPLSIFENVETPRECLKVLKPYL